jgi:NADP-dependent 3-hydroxy acid dehydrogenase YdfG
MVTKVVIITGASSGIGKACAEAFLKKGFSVVISGRKTDRLNEVANALDASGSRILAITADVSKEDDCKALIQAAVQKFGRIDVLINNAGISMRALFADLDLSVIRQLMDTNFWGTVYCTKFALPYLLEAKGSVVGVSSIAGKKGLPGRTGYSSSKFAMEGFLETLRTENLKKDLHVLVACPGFTATEIRNTALSADGSTQGESPRDEQKMMTATEVANEIVIAVEKRKRDLILTGNGKLTVWLNKFFPAMMDKLVYNHMAKEPGSPFK